MALMGVGACYIGFRGLQLTVLAPSYHPRRKGRMIAKGTACATTPNEMQTTPLSQTPCIAYEFFILEPRNSPKGGTSYAFLHRQSQGQWNLSVQTPRGQIQVKPNELDLEHIHFEDRQDLWNEFIESRSLIFSSRTRNHSNAQANGYPSNLNFERKGHSQRGYNSSLGPPEA